jgi:aromatic amino acid aminotransferase I
MYINPTGSNPTGAVLSGERRREIYDICSEYDMIILEDNPYYFMQFR